MPEATVTVSGVFDPKAGKANGTIKDTEGKMYLAEPKLLSQVRAGGRYTLGYKFGNGNFGNLMFVEKVSAVAGGAPAAGGSGQTVNSYVNDREKQEHIFVCGAVNSILSNPSVDVTQIDTGWLAKITSAARAAYALAWSNKPAEAKKNDMDDEIPY